MGIEVRLVGAPEHEAWLAHLGRAFFMHQPDGKLAYYLSTIDEGRSRGAFDGDTVVGTLRSFEAELTVPGSSTIGASALTAVSVAGTHRRQGLLTEMITGDLRDSKDRGEIVSILLASEYPIYGRFGYGAATEMAQFEFSTLEMRFLSPSVGSVEFVDLATMRAIAPAVFDRFRLANPGSLDRRDDWWDRVLRTVKVPGVEPRKGFQAVYRSPSGDVEGYVLFEGKLGWDAVPPVGTLTVEELVATSPAAERGLWSFCVGIDLTTNVVAPNRAPDDVLPLLVRDGRRVRMVDRNDHLWVRLLDPAAALASRSYAVEGRLVLEIRDELALAGGTFALETTREGTTCTSTSESPDLSVDVADLGATYLGGVTWSRLAAARRIDEHRSGARAEADAMFATARAPWCVAYF